MMSWNNKQKRTSILIVIICLGWYLLFGSCIHDYFIYYMGALSVWSMEHGMIWTIVTCLFTHDGIIHLMNNMIYLLIILMTAYAFKIKDRLIWLVFILGGVFGNILLLYNLLQQNKILTPVMGASGSIYALGGMLVWYTTYMLWTHQIERTKWNKIAWWLYLIALVSLVCDIPCEVGGTLILHVSGLVFGLLSVIPISIGSYRRGIEISDR